MLLEFFSPLLSWLGVDLVALLLGVIALILVIKE